MAFSAGMYFENGSGNIVFAEHPNSMLNAQRGNYVTNTAGNGGAVTANGTSDLTTTTADIDIADVDTFNNDAINNLTGITSIDLSEAYDDLTSGQSLYVLIYVKANGTISDPSDTGGNEGVGTPATTGQQLPPAIPENSVPLALITLTNGDTTVDAADIEDYRIEGPQGAYINGLFRVVEGSIVAFDINETTGHIGIGAVSNSNYGVFIDAPAEQIGANQSFDRVRIDDQGAITVQTGTTSTLVTTLHVEEPNIILTGTGAVTTAATIYTGGPPTEATNNYSIFSDAGDIRFDASNIIFNDENDTDETLFNLDLLNRTLDLFSSGDTGITSIYGPLIVDTDTFTKLLIDDDTDVTGSLITGGNNSYLLSRNETIFGIDTNNDTTDRLFLWGKDAILPNDVNWVDLMSLSESGDLTLYAGNLDLNGNDISNLNSITDDLQDFTTLINNTNTSTTAGDRGLRIKGGQRPGAGSSEMTYLKIETNDGGVVLDITADVAAGGSQALDSTTNSANVYYRTSDGRLQWVSSNSKYKDNLQAIDYDRSAFYNLNVYKYESLLDDNEEYIGFMADDVVSVHPKLGQYLADGEVQNFDHRGFMAIMFEELKQHEKTIRKLETEINDVKALIT